jgi:hypothetical protein
LNELRQRRPPLSIPALRESARGQLCTVKREGVCNGRRDTTVWAHFNWQRYGKGVGLKVHDPFGFFACRACHDWLDREHPPDGEDYAIRAHFESLFLLHEQGRVTYKRLPPP